MLDQQEALAASVVGRDPNEVVVYKYRQPYVDGPTVAAIQTIFQRSRLSHQGWQARRLEGRIDPRNVWRNDARGNVDIFKDRHAQSATKVNLWLLIDASGSMNGVNACRAQDVTGTLIESFKRIPTVRLHVFQHNAQFGGYVTLFRIAEPGHGNKVDQMLKNITGGNADGFALEAIGRMAFQAQRPDERTLIIMISDGKPSVHGVGAYNHSIENHSTLVANRLRDKGAIVMAVAIEGSNQAHVQMYGEDAVISFNQESPSRWFDLARGFATLLGRQLR